MHLVSFADFPVAAIAWQPHEGAWNLTLCAKATFELVHGGQARVAAAQEPAGGDAHFDESRHAALRAPSDFAPYKPRGDVLFVGSAHAPGGAAVEALEARIEVGDFAKSLRVVGERAWTRGSSGVVAGPPAPFREVPLRYERAARAGDNLSGVAANGGFADTSQALPNVEPLGKAEGVTPGFGPLPPAWRARRSQLGEAAIIWAYRVHAGATTNGTSAIAGAPPNGFDFGFFNAAPRDQQVDVLRPELTIVLENLHPRHARFQTRLPNVRPRLFRLGPTSSRPAEVAMRCDTVWIDGERGLAVVSFRGMVTLASPDPSSFGRFVIAAEAPDERVNLARVRAALDGSDEPPAPRAPSPPPPKPAPEIEAQTRARPESIESRTRAQPGSIAAQPSAKPPPPPLPPPSRPAFGMGGLGARPMSAPAKPPAPPPKPPPPPEEIEDLDVTPDDPDEVEPELAVVHDETSQDDADTPTPSSRPPPSALPFVAAKTDHAVLPFKPGSPPLRAAALPEQKLDGLPFKHSSETTDERFLALPFKPAAARSEPRVVGNPDHALPFVHADEPGAKDGAPESRRAGAFPGPRWTDETRRYPPGGPPPDAIAQSFPDDMSTTSQTDAGELERTTVDPPKAFPIAPQMVVKPLGGLRLGGPQRDATTASKLGSTALGDSIDDEEATSQEPSSPGERASSAPAENPPQQGLLGGAPPAVADAIPWRGLPAPPPLMGIVRAAEPEPAAPPKRPELLGAKLFDLPKPPELSAAPAPRTDEPPAAQPAPPRDASAPFDPASVPIERCAAVQAELALKRTPIAAVLEKAALSSDDWQAVERHWMATITKETERGTTTLLGLYDAAYVAALERLRGALSTADYAKIVVGVERGDVGAVLAQLGLPRTALMRIERVWTKRLAEDPALAESVGAAVDAAQKA